MTTGCWSCGYPFNDGFTVSVSRQSEPNVATVAAICRPCLKLVEAVLTARRPVPSLGRDAS